MITRINKCIGMAVLLTLYSSAIFASSVPYILRMSDAVAPGKAFNLNGFGFENDSLLQVAMEISSNDEIRAKPSVKAIIPEIIQTDRNGNFIVAVMPADAVPGVYDVWVRNRGGWSASRKLNLARPLFISEREAFKGLSIKICGRNFDGKEFRTNGNNTRVRLNDGNGDVYESLVTGVNPYRIIFKISREPKGKYFVEVSNNNGVNWNRLDNGQQLTILDAPGDPASNDPLGLGVSWASHFNWRNTHRVQVSYGERDVTSMVQATVDETAAEPGGGIVYFPDGIYKIKKIDLPKNIVLEGESRACTIISYIGSDKDFIACRGAAITDGHVGIANMTLTVSREMKARPDVFVNLGQAVIWQGVRNIHLRTASEMFIYNLKIDYDFTETTKDRRGLPVSVIGNERYLIANCDFKGFRMESHNYISDYVTVENNRFEFAQGVFIYTGNYLFLENNHIIGHTEINREKHGFMFRANSYIFNNTVEHTGSEPGPLNENWNDGEALCNETPGGNHNFGSVKTATANSIVVGETAGPFEVPEVEIYSHRSVLIVGGRGLGQCRRVSHIDKNSKTIFLERNWELWPDSSSRFTLMEPNENITYYKNTIVDNPKGYWLFGNSIDCVVAENTSKDCDGIFIFSCMYSSDKKPSPEYYFVPNYFNRIIGNTIVGVSRKSHRAGIGINTTREGKANGAYFAVEAYANEFRNNTVTGNPLAKPLAEVTEAPPVSGIFIYATVHSSGYDNKNIAGDATNHIIEDNILSNLSAGINLSRCIYGQVLRNNTIASTVHIPFNDSTGSQHTDILGTQVTR